ncbi:hypothetical protein OROGR_018015 [Orobanche gracilis]
MQTCTVGCFLRSSFAAGRLASTIIKLGAHKALANDNSERRCSITDTHTMGPKSLAQVKNKMKKCDPKQGTPSDANVFIETRKRKAGRKYKTNTVALDIGEFCATVSSEDDNGTPMTKGGPTS